jgi:hypothetical protein
MFVDIEFASLIRPSPGIYRRRLEVFGREGAAFRAWLYRYTRSDEPSPCACDLVVRASTGDLFVRDYELKPDGMWQDSDGFVAESIAGLLPAEVRTLELDHFTDLDPIEVLA